jgi:hypothetical protein
MAHHRSLFPHGGLFENLLFVVTLLTVPPELVSDFDSEIFFDRGELSFFADERHSSCRAILNPTSSTTSPSTVIHIWRRLSGH